MIANEIQVRVRYGETDKMGIVYHGNYPLYYEMGRTELMREMGLTYSELEKTGIFMPVLRLNVLFLKPAYYDDLLIIRTSVKEMPASRIKFYYEIYNEKGELVNKGDTELAFVDVATRKPRKPPDRLLEILNNKGIV